MAEEWAAEESAVEQALALAPQLVIGIGNRLRSDDGVGPRLAEEVEAWGLSGVESMAVQQLSPELAPRLAACERVLFIDAWLVDWVGAAAATAPLLEPLVAEEVVADPRPRFSHHSTPRPCCSWPRGSTAGGRRPGGCGSPPSASSSGSSCRRPPPPSWRRPGGPCAAGSIAMHELALMEEVRRLADEQATAQGRCASTRCTCASAASRGWTPRRSPSPSRW